MYYDVTYISGNDLKLHTRTIFEISKESAVIKAFELEGVNFENRLVSVTEHISSEDSESTGGMTREEAINYFKKSYASGDTNDERQHNEAIDIAIKAIKALEQTRWIPVSERLPEVMDGTNGECSDDVLICVADDELITISTGFYGYYPNSSSDQGWWSMWAYGCHQLDSKYKVVAWMPLPQPYKAESED